MKSGQKSSSVPRWASAILISAGLYNLAWGAGVVLFPLAVFEWTQLELPLYPQIWQCVGMIVGVYGIGYLIAARDPARHWPIVLVGLLGKIFGPIGFVISAFSKSLPWSWSIIILTNDLIWWVPFASILYFAFRSQTDTSGSQDGLRQELTYNEAIHSIRSQRGATLAQLSARQPVLVIFLRHAGCTFCREAVDDLARQRSHIESLGVQLALVHMSNPMRATQMTSRVDLDDVHRFSDPHCALYNAFGLERGSLKQLLGMHVLWRGLVAGLVQGHGIGSLEGDGFRMPGAFLLKQGRIISEYRAKTAADRPNYIQLAIPGSQVESSDAVLQGVAG